jgi:hypothetical protein
MCINCILTPANDAADLGTLAASLLDKDWVRRRVLARI